MCYTQYIVKYKTVDNYCVFCESPLVSFIYSQLCYLIVYRYPIKIRLGFNGLTTNFQPKLGTETVLTKMGLYPAVGENFKKKTISF